jgi:hypothetical protein
MARTGRKRMLKKMKVGSKKIVKGVTYQLNTNFRWEKVKKAGLDIAGQALTAYQRGGRQAGINAVVEGFSNLYKKHKGLVNKRFATTSQGVKKRMRGTLTRMQNTAQAELGNIYSASEGGIAGIRKQSKKSIRAIKRSIAKEALFGPTWNPQTGLSGKRLHKGIKQSTKAFADIVGAQFGRKAGRRARLYGAIISHKFRPSKRKRR